MVNNVIRFVVQDSHSCGCEGDEISWVVTKTVSREGGERLKSGTVTVRI